MAGAWYGAWIGFSVAMNTGLGAFLNTVGLSVLAGVLGTVGVVSGVVCSLFYLGFLFQRDHKVLLNINERITRDAFTLKILRSDNVNSPRYAAAHVLFSRAEALYTSTEDTSEASLYRKPFMAQEVMVVTDGERESNFKYLRELARSLADRHSVNHWFRAARLLLSPQVTEVALRGLSPIMKAGELDEGCSQILEIASWRSKGKKKCPGREKDTVRMSII